MAKKVVAACGDSLRGKAVAVLGLTFKPNTDDMRDAPALALISALKDGGARVRAYDPEGMEAARGMIEEITFSPDPLRLRGGRRRAGDRDRVGCRPGARSRPHPRLMRAPVLVDLRNIYPPEEVLRHGFTHTAIGRSA